MPSINFPLSKQAIIAPLTISFIAIICFLLPDSLTNALTYDRLAIANGDYWRIISGHFNHTNSNHLMLNLAGLAVLWALHGDHYQIRKYFSAFFYIALLTSFSLYIFAPELSRYVGLSGILHGIFVWGAIKDIEHGWRTGYLLLAGITIKVIWEQLFGASEDVIAFIESAVATDAHLWGALAGAFFAFKEKHINKQAKS